MLVARVLGTGSVAGGAYENDTRSTDPVIPADLAALPRHTVCFFVCLFDFQICLIAFFFIDLGEGWKKGKRIKKDKDPQTHCRILVFVATYYYLLQFTE